MPVLCFNWRSYWKHTFFCHTLARSTFSLSLLQLWKKCIWHKFYADCKVFSKLSINRGPTEDIIHYFTLMSSELHYLDIILKIENLTLMSSASGKFDINVLSIWENHLSNTHIFVILPVLFLFSHVLNASEQLQLLIYALLSLKCRELHLRVF